MKKNINTVHYVLIEKHLDKNSRFLKGVSENYLKIIIENNSDTSLLNTIQKVKITNLSNDTLFGEIIK